MSLDRTFHALADPTRRSILQLVSTGPASISELARPFGIAFPRSWDMCASSRRRGLLTTEKVGRARECTLGQNASTKLGNGSRRFACGTAARRARPLRLDSHGATRMSPGIRLQRWFEAPRTSCSTPTQIPMRNARSGPGPTGSWSPGAISVSEASGSSGLARPRRPYIERNSIRGEATPPRLRVEHRVAGWIPRRIADGDHPSMAGWTDALTLTQRGVPRRPSNEGSPKGGTSSWTGSWPGSRHGPRPERAEEDGVSRGTVYLRCPCPWRVRRRAHREHGATGWAKAQGPASTTGCYRATATRRPSGLFKDRCDAEGCDGQGHVRNLDVAGRVHHRTQRGRR